MSQPYDFSMTAGDDKILRFTLTSGGTPVPLTGAEITFALFSGLGSTPVITKTNATGGDITIQDAAAGIFCVPLVAADTMNCDGAYTYEVVVVDNDNLRSTSGEGVISIKKTRIKPVIPTP